MHHEITAARKIIEEIPEKDRGQVESIEIEVGELAEFTAEELKQSIEDLTGWKVEVKKVISEIQCSCGFIGQANILNRQGHILIYNCPKCKSFAVRPLVGQDIKLKRVVSY